MNKKIHLFAFFLFIFFSLINILNHHIMPIGFAKSTASKISDDKHFVIMRIQYGTLVMQLFPNKAPNHVTRIETLSSQGFYDNLKFHRAIPGFMVQTGDPKGNGTGGSNLPDLKAEFNDIPHKAGVVSMARSSHPDSANSQFFIMLGEHSYLDHNYTAFGKVIFGINNQGEKTDGMDILRQIHMGTQQNNGAVADPTVIEQMYLLPQQSEKDKYNPELDHTIWNYIEGGNHI